MPAIDEDDKPKKKLTHEIGQDLTLLSVDELHARAVRPDFDRSKGPRRIIFATVDFGLMPSISEELVPLRRCRTRKRAARSRMSSNEALHGQPSGLQTPKS